MAAPRFTDPAEAVTEFVVRSGGALLEGGRVRWTHTTYRNIGKVADVLVSLGWMHRDARGWYVTRPGEGAAGA